MSNQFILPHHTKNDFVVGEPVFTFDYRDIRHSYITHIGSYYITLSEFGTRKFAPSSIYKLNEIIKFCFDFAREVKNKFDTNAISEAQIKAEQYFSRPIWVIYYVDFPQIQTKEDTPVFFIEKAGTKNDDFFNVEDYFKKTVTPYTNNQNTHLHEHCWAYENYGRFYPVTYTSTYTAHLTSSKIKFNKRTKVRDMESRYWFGVDKVVYNMRNESVGVFTGNITFWNEHNEEYWKNTFAKYLKSISISIISARYGSCCNLSPKSN